MSSKWWKSSAAIVALLCFSQTASAGVYTDDLTRCLVKSASPADQTLLVQWIFTALALNPSVKPYSSVSPEQREDFNRRVVALMERLMFVDCHTEAVSATKYEGDAAIEAGFQTLGQVASRGLMNDPASQAGMNEFAKYMDKQKWDDFAKEAGQPTPPPASAPAK